MINNSFDVKLRQTQVSDLDYFYQFHVDNEANYHATLIDKSPDDKLSYIAKYLSLLSNPTVNNKTIIVDDVIVGSIAKFERESSAELTYLIDKNFWGKGIATKALKQFLNTEIVRPIFGRVAIDNFGSQKVLLKCGFIKVATSVYFSNTRKTETTEFIYKLL